MTGGPHAPGCSTIDWSAELDGIRTFRDGFPCDRETRDRLANLMMDGLIARGLKVAPTAQATSAPVEVLGRARQAEAAVVLFRGGFDTAEIAAALGLGSEADVIAMMHPRVGTAE